MARSIQLLAPWNDSEGTLFAAGRELLVVDAEYDELRSSGKGAAIIDFVDQQDEHGPSQGYFTAPYTDADGCLYATGAPATIPADEAAVLRNDGKISYAPEG